MKYIIIQYPPLLWSPDRSTREHDDVWVREPAEQVELLPERAQPPLTATATVLLQYSYMRVVLEPGEVDGTEAASLTPLPKLGHVHGCMGNLMPFVP
jgi:hypothetical protein